MTKAERAAVLGADFRTAVSPELVDWWREEFAYSGDRHAIIPTTLNSQWREALLDTAQIERRRAMLGFSSDDVIFVYSGSDAPWQGFALLSNFVDHVVADHPHAKFLLLSPDTQPVRALVARHPRHVQQAFLEAHTVPETLQACDYGVLIRPDSITNKVAAPTKWLSRILWDCDIL